MHIHLFNVLFITITAYSHFTYHAQVTLYVHTCSVNSLRTINRIYIINISVEYSLGCVLYSILSVLIDYFALSVTVLLSSFLMSYVVLC